MDILSNIAALMLAILIVLGIPMKYLIIGTLIYKIIEIIIKKRTRSRKYGSKNNYYRYYNPKLREKQGRYSYYDGRMDKTSQKNFKQRIL
ncbi:MULTISPECIES: hypothetical protein [Clostridia]|jgi:hypothetical protein|uniref:hypothetical protein n=1 Tax=Clostridia TaxID=186801 RepID=UPI00033872B3|nr:MULTISPECIES: hypothetical protein [Clostridia]MBS5595834.1 hypothetical protein [Peptostreptococcus sp.]MDB8821730.1 hypothetical protein [Peptostreptococcus anaerobius]MDB8826359.1 hypothetical protein [Peptostreptococcus anaerobius]MDB8828230.1 hypothetical protein [Peptostreptococcus anaerobius]MDB8829976.1 hypothetical protein [Peptostreptococcus anaerobius]